MAVRYLYGWDKPMKIGGSAPFVNAAVQKVLARYAVEAAERTRTYTPVDTGILQKSISAQPDRTKKLLYWVGSNLSYAQKIEFLWHLGMPFSKNRNPNASPRPIARGINDIKDAFKAATGKALKGTWEKI